MKIVVTGANGFLGRALVRRLIDDNGLGEPDRPLQCLTLVGRKLPRTFEDVRVRYVEGDIRDAAVRARAIDGGVDCLFHLAGALINRTEPDFDYGRSVNLDAALALFDELRACAQPRVVFTSTIAVYGPVAGKVDDDTVPRPILSYGTHKLMVEEYLNDITRRGFVDARTLRIPGTLPRPRLPDRAFSPAFSSNIFHAVAANEAFDCPVSPAAQVWALSLQACIDNLIHAARLKAERLPQARAWMVPCLCTTMGELLEAMVREAGEQVRELVHWNPIPELEEKLARFPPLSTPLADTLGFRDDGTVDVLTRRTFDVAHAGRAPR